MSYSFDHVIQKLERFLERDNFKGYDPYDALNSDFIKSLTFGSKKLRIAATQLMRRSPINFRSLLGLPKGVNPKGMGLFAHAYLNRFEKTKNKEYLNKATRILKWLEDNSCTGYSGYCWGYNFDWQSRAFFIPKGTPTIVNTSFIGRAFLKAYDVLGDDEYLKIARGSCDFILKDLHQFKEKDAICFSYTPIDHYYVHNATALGSSLLGLVYAKTGEKRFVETAKKSIAYVVKYQNKDGSWKYGEDQIALKTGTDNFHTGYILVSLKNISNSFDFADDDGFKLILEKGYEYYKNAFWEEDGCPKYYANKKYPIDLHCSAQGIITFLKFKQYDNEAVDIAKKIANWAIENMWDNKKGYFYFQKTKLFTNKIQYLRWPNAWMYLALTRLANIL